MAIQRRNQDKSRRGPPAKAKEDDRKAGEVTTIFGAKGYGYIMEDGGGIDEFFFHASALENCEWEDVSPGDKVTFRIQDSQKGPRAVKVEKVG